MITVKFSGQTKSVTTGADGRWRVVLAPVAAGNSKELIVSGKKDTVTFHRVLMGEVWLCLGDVTMDFPLKEKVSMNAGTASAIHIFYAKAVNASTPRFDITGGWQVNGGDTGNPVPAMAYYFARSLAEQLKVPVGIINLAGNMPINIIRDGIVKGTPVEAFISDVVLNAEPAAKPILDYFKLGFDMRDALNEYGHAMDDWKFKNGSAFGMELKRLEKREPDVWYDYVTEMKKAGNKLPLPPKKPTTDSIYSLTNRPTQLFNGMVAPLAGFAIRGIAWSQGIANAPRAYQYRSLFPALIGSLRQAWGINDLPFIYLQQFPVYSKNIDPRTWAELREAQSMALSLPGTAMAPTSDLPVQTAFIPADYETLGKRLAIAARGLAYNQPITWVSPRVESIKFKDGKVIITFNRPVKAPDGKIVQGFAIAESPYRWGYAAAEIDGTRIVLHHPKIKNPIAVRYNWVVDAGRQGSLIGLEGLPVASFRSDDWTAYTNTPMALSPNAQAQINRIDLYPSDDPSLPYVLLMGDSIMMGYFDMVADLLKGIANVWSQVSGVAPAEAARKINGSWKLADKGEFAVIHFNDGLHSMPPRETDAQFEAGLRNYITSLKTLHAKLIWATITPAPDTKNQLSEASWNPSVLSRNELSKKVAAEMDIPVDDLYQAIIGRREQLQGFANLHFTSEGSKLLGETVAAAILKELKP